MQVPNPDSNLDHNPHGRGGLSLDLNPVCLHVNATNLQLDQDLANSCICCIHLLVDLTDIFISEGTGEGGGGGGGGVWTPSF